ncbi:MAG: four helix bundle protein [Parcubacteria group bacterium]
MAAFLTPQEKAPYIKFAIKKMDLMKIFFMLLWETKSIDDKKYIGLSEKLNEIGRNLGGWLGKINTKKENSPNETLREK